MRISGITKLQFWFNQPCGKHCAQFTISCINKYSALVQLTWKSTDPQLHNFIIKPELACNKYVDISHDGNTIIKEIFQEIYFAPLSALLLRLVVWCSLAPFWTFRTLWCFWSACRISLVCTSWRQSSRAKCNPILHAWTVAKSRSTSSRITTSGCFAEPGLSGLFFCGQ